MTNIDFGGNPIVLPKPVRIRASAEAPRNLIEAFVDDGAVKSAISMLRRAPIRLPRGKAGPSPQGMSNYDHRVAITVDFS
jgi:hypothetical protein